MYYYENYISISSKCHITNKCLELCTCHRLEASVNMWLDHGVIASGTEELIHLRWEKREQKRKRNIENRRYNKNDYQMSIQTGRKNVKQKLFR